jgi:transposase
LVAHRVSQVVMEATGVYWKPVWHILEDDFELLLVNARHVKQVPGRKTDMSDAQWLCQLAEAGLLKGSFVPPKPVRALRQLTRYRTTQVAERQREANRLHKALEDTNIKLDCVASDILGVSGRLMLDALVAGTTYPEVLADLAKGRLRKKLPALRESLEGRFDRLHALIGLILATWTSSMSRSAGSLTRSRNSLSLSARATSRCCKRSPASLSAAHRTSRPEIATDMSVFPTDKHLASWAGQCPGNHQSAGKQRSGRTRKGFKWLNEALKEAALAAHPHEEQLPPGALPAPATPDRTRPRDRCRQTRNPAGHLAHGQHRRDLPRPPRRLLPTPRPQARHPTPRRPTRAPRTHRHPAGGSRIGGKGVLPLHWLVLQSQCMAGRPLVPAGKDAVRECGLCQMTERGRRGHRERSPWSVISG